MTWVEQLFLYLKMNSIQDGQVFIGEPFMSVQRPEA